MPFITKSGLEKLANYKYVSGKYTTLDNLLNPFWIWISQLLPLWLAPNLVTFIGFMCTILSTALIFWYDLSLSNHIPNYVFLVSSVCVFIYHTLDAVDGKQARRTNSSSPLGQLFDHGCDSFALVVVGLGMIAGFRCDSTFDKVLFAVIIQTTFWCPQWGQYVTGVLQTNVGQFGVTQAELFVVLIHFLTGMFGQQFWSKQLFLGIKLTDIIYKAIALVLLVSCALQWGRVAIKKAEIGGIIKENLAIFVLLTLQIVWGSRSQLKAHLGIVFLTFGMLMSLFACKIIICSTTKVTYPVFHPQLVFPGLATFILLVFPQAAVPLLWATFIVNLVLTLTFLRGIIHQITQKLGIQCFRIKVKSK